MLFKNIRCFIPYLFSCVVLLNDVSAFDLGTSITLMKVTNLKNNFLHNKEITPICRQHISDALFSRKKWAIQMLDASGKIPAGILRGTVTYFGSYEQCLDIVASDESNGKTLFQGKYCKLSISISSLSTLIGMDEKKFPQLQWHGCFPSSCSTSDVINAARMLFGLVKIQVKGGSCEVKEPVVPDKMQIASICVFTILGLVLLSGTVADIVSKISKKNTAQSGTVMQVLTSFSVYSNAVEVLSTETSPNHIGSLDGIRFLSTCWVILGHVHILDLRFIGNGLTFLDFTKDFLTQLIANATLVVDVFLVLSGMMMVCSTMKVYHTARSMNWLAFFAYRYWRLTPPLVFVIFLNFLAPLLGSGPLWKELWSESLQKCRETWWTELLYISNMFRKECISVAWYLSLDTQLHAISPLILYLLWRKPHMGIILNTIFLLATIIIPAAIVIRNDSIPITLPRFTIESPERSEQYMKAIYPMLWCRMPSFCNGIFIGYLISTKTKIRLHSFIRSLLWVISTSVILTIVFSTYYWSNGYDSSKEFNAFYVSTSRFFFSLGISWLIYACATGYGGIINRILSYRGFIPLSRISFMAYLIHNLFTKSFGCNFTDRIMFSRYFMVVLYLGILGLTFGGAFFAHIFFEMPFSNLSKIIFNTHKKKTEKNDELCKPLLSE